MAQQISKIGNSDLSQTALQQLIEWATLLKNNSQQCTDWICIKEKAEELLQMEKEQIMKSFKSARIPYKYDADLRLNGFEDAEHYYNETYGKE